MRTSFMSTAHLDMLEYILEAMNIHAARLFFQYSNNSIMKQTLETSKLKSSMSLTILTTYNMKWQ